MKWMVYFLVLASNSFAMAATPTRTPAQALSFLREHITQMKVAGRDGIASEAPASDFLDNVLSRGSYNGGCSSQQGSSVEDCVVFVDEFSPSGKILFARYSLQFSVLNNQLVSNELLYLISY